MGEGRQAGSAILMSDYKQMYEELRSMLGIHHSHDHAAVLRYAQNAMDRDAIARRIVVEANGFANKLSEEVRKYP